MKKKFLIPILILIVVTMLGLVIGIKIGTSGAKQEDVSNEDQIEKKLDEGSGENEENEEMIYLSDILSFDRSGGNLTLYSPEGNVLDELDLKTVSAKNDNFRYNIKTLEAEEAETRVEEINKDIYIKSEDGELVKARFNKNEITLYDKDGNEISDVNLESLLDSINQATSESLDDNLEETNKSIPRTTFTNFRTVNNELVFRDDARNLLILVDIIDEKIVTDTILEGMDLRNLLNVYLTNDFIYLTFEGDSGIIKTFRNGKEAIRISVEDNPRFVVELNGYIYFSTAKKVGKYNSVSNKVEYIEFDDETLDMYFNDEFLYVINQFGKGRDTSALIKINLNTFRVKDIQELKGIGSRFIGIDKDIAYIRQRDGIKEVDLDSLKLIRAFSRKEGTPVQIKDRVLYKIEDGKLTIVNLENVEVLGEFKNNDFNIYLR